MVLELRENIIVIFRKYQQIIVPLCKFILGLLIYTIINSIGYSSPAFYFITDSGFTIVFIIFMGIMFALLPINANYLFMIFFITLQFSAQLEVALVVFLGLLAMYLFYGHMGKKENVLILAILLGFYFNIPYVVPIFAGVYLSITSIIPIALGVLAWSYSSLVISLMDAETAAIGFGVDAINIDTDDLLYAFMRLYQSFSLDDITIQTWIIVTIAMFAVFIFVYIVSHISINHAKEIAIVMGTVLCIIIFSFVSVFTDIGDFASIFFFSLLSGIIVYIISFFEVALDYKNAQRVEFQDEDYYYYVKLVPKKRVAGKKKVIADLLDEDEL